MIRLCKYICVCVCCIFYILDVQCALRLLDPTVYLATMEAMLALQ